MYNMFINVIGGYMINTIDIENLINKTKDNVKNLTRGLMIKPCVVVIQIGNNSIYNDFIESREATCIELGIYFKLVKYDGLTLEKEIINKIIELNNDEYVDGIVVLNPLTLNYNYKRIISFIKSSKDIMGVTDANIGKFINNKIHFLPPVVFATVLSLEQDYPSLSGLNITVVGDNNVINKYIINFLLNKNAFVTACHEVNNKITADIIITNLNKKHYIKAEMLPKDVTVIDLGVTKEDDEIYGDVDDKAYNKIKLYNSMKSGIDELASVLLNKNLITSYNNHKGIKESNEINEKYKDTRK